MKNCKITVLILTLFLFGCSLISLPTPTSVDFPLTSETESVATQSAVSTMTVTVAPVLSPTHTLTPDPIQDIRARFQNPDLMLYEEYSSTDILLDGEILKLSIVRKEGDSWGFESLQDISDFLHLALVDCTKYRFGHGIDGCKIKESAPYKFVELREYLPSGELKAYVRFTVGDKKYFSGFDGTQIVESEIFETADESFLQP